MCGIVGWLETRRPDPSLRFEESFEQMVDTLAARGPDGRGAAFLEGAVALGHRRLAIVDPTPAGAQPMRLGPLTVTFNGEIYNHPALRRELEARGHRYRTRCDTESILHAYAEWGIDCVERLEGIFAFGLWDATRERLLLARDRFGVKPLYYVAGPRLGTSRSSSSGTEIDFLLFASQPRALLASPRVAPRPDLRAFRDFLAYGVVPAERAAFAGMAKLPPAHRLVWDRRPSGAPSSPRHSVARSPSTVRIDRYWDLDTAVAEAEPITDFDTARVALERALEEAVVAQRMSDVPIATFLSGGVDSSLLTACLAAARSDRGARGEALHTFTVGFAEAPSDERAFARAVADSLGTRHHVAVLRRRDALARLDAVAEAYDEPFGMGSAFPMLRVAELAHDAGFKVVLSGDGADEVFAGYRHYDGLAARYARRGHATADHLARRGRAAWTRAVFGRFDPLSAYRPHDAMMPVALRRALLPEGVFDEFLDEADDWRGARYFPRDREAIDAARRFDLATYLPDEILSKVDRATMHHAIEARVPFLDRSLVELAFRIDSRLHYRGGERKALLKAAAARWLPRSVLGPRKKGFSIPVDTWIDRAPGDSPRGRFVDAIRDGQLVAAGLLRPGLGRHLERLQASFLMQLYLAERWARRWLE